MVEKRTAYETEGAKTGKDILKVFLNETGISPEKIDGWEYLDDKKLLLVALIDGGAISYSTKES